MTQTDLGEELGRSRQWVAQLEGARFGNRPFAIEPQDLVQIALILNVSPVHLLEVSNLPKGQWPNLSYMRSNDVNIRTIDLTNLSDNQIRLIEGLVAEFKTGTPNDPRKRRR